MTFLSQLKCVLDGKGLRHYSGFHGPISRVRDSRVWFKDAGFIINEIRLKAGLGFGFDKLVTYWSHSKSPHHLVVFQPVLTF